MKKFSQYINSKKDCNCGQQVDESILSALKDRLQSTLPKLIGGAGLQDVYNKRKDYQEKTKNAARDQKMNYAKCIESAKRDKEDWADAKTPSEKQRMGKKYQRKLEDCKKILDTKVDRSEKDIDKEVNANFADAQQEYDAMMAAISAGSGGGSGSGGGGGGSGGTGRP